MVLSKIDVRRLSPDAVFRKATSGSAAFDLATVYDVSIPTLRELHDWNQLPYMQIHTGIALKLPDGYCGHLYLRSSWSKSLMLANGVGLIDSDYRGEIMGRVVNYSGENVLIPKGTRLLQLEVVPVHDFDVCMRDQIVNLEDDLDFTDTVRGTGGFGSTGN